MQWQVRQSDHQESSCQDKGEEVEGNRWYGPGRRQLCKRWRKAEDSKKEGLKVLWAKISGKLIKPAEDRAHPPTEKKEGESKLPQKPIVVCMRATGGENQQNAGSLWQ